MNIFITGSSTTLGSSLMEIFFSEGHTIYTCDQIPDKSVEFSSYISKLTNNNPVNIVILLQANEIFRTKENLKRSSDTPETLLDFNKAVFDFFSNSTYKPSVILSSSSLSIYATEQSSPVVEDTHLGSDYLACFYQELESQAEVAVETGIRVIHLRFGEILSKLSEPALLKIPIINAVPCFVGDSKRSVSWISREDAARAIQLFLTNDGISGPMNITSGDTPKRTEFSKTVCRFYGLKKTPPLPIVLNRIIFGRERSPLLESGIKGVPLRLMELGFFFEDIALHDYLKKP